MCYPVATTLLYAPAKLLVDAKIVRLTPQVIQEKMSNHWWDDASLLPVFKTPPIDRHWDWNQQVVEFDGKLLPSEKIGIMTSDGAVQGAMLVSTEPVRTSTGKGLFLELLFTAPRNRRSLRRDGADLYVGVGKMLLAWASYLSKQSGYKGRLRLDASPSFIQWYENRGFSKILNATPVSYEGVTYTPMVLTPKLADKLIIESGVTPT